MGERECPGAPGVTEPVSAHRAKRVRAGAVLPVEEVPWVAAWPARLSSCVTRLMLPEMADTKLPDTPGGSVNCYNH